MGREEEEQEIFTYQQECKELERRNRELDAEMERLSIEVHSLKLEKEQSKIMKANLLERMSLLENFSEFSPTLGSPINTVQLGGHEGISGNVIAKDIVMQIENTFDSPRFPISANLHDLGLGSMGIEGIGDIGIIESNKIVRRSRPSPHNLEQDLHLHLQTDPGNHGITEEEYIEKDIDVDEGSKVEQDFSYEKLNVINYEELEVEKETKGDMFGIDSQLLIQEFEFEKEAEGECGEEISHVQLSLNGEDAQSFGGLGAHTVIDNLHNPQSTLTSHSLDQ